MLVGIKGSGHTPIREHGYNAVVVAIPLARDKYQIGYWSKLGGVPGWRKTLNWAWTAADRDAVHFAARIPRCAVHRRVITVGRKRASRSMAANVEGEVILPEPVDLADALLIVRVRDTTMADAPTPLLGLARRVVSGSHVTHIPFSVRLRCGAGPRSQVSIEAELRLAQGRRLTRGDWLTMTEVACPLLVGSAGAKVPVARVG